VSIPVSSATHRRQRNQISPPRTRPSGTTWVLHSCARVRTKLSPTRQESLLMKEPARERLRHARRNC
jgi:hypothetical protein